MQRWLLLRRGLVDRDAVLVWDAYLLSDRKLEYDHLSGGRLLSGARAGQLYAESDRQLLRHDRSIGLHFMHVWFILRDDRAERADGQLQRRLPLPDRLELDDSSLVPADNILSDCQSRARCVPRVVVLRDGGHAPPDHVHYWLLLRDRASCGAYRCVRGRLLLRCGLEHGVAVSVHEWHVLSARQLPDDRVSGTWLLRVKRHGELHLVLARLFL